MDPSVDSASALATFLPVSTREEGGPREGELSSKPFHSFAGGQGPEERPPSPLPER